MGAFDFCQMRNIFGKIHITINIRLTPHDTRQFVCKETFNRSVFGSCVVQLENYNIYRWL